MRSGGEFSTCSQGEFSGCSCSKFFNRGHGSGHSEFSDHSHGGFAGHGRGRGQSESSAQGRSGFSAQGEFSSQGHGRISGNGRGKISGLSCDGSSGHGRGAKTTLNPGASHSGGSVMRNPDYVMNSHQDVVCVSFSHIFATHNSHCSSVPAAMMAEIFSIAMALLFMRNYLLVVSTFAMVLPEAKNVLS